MKPYKPHSSEWRSATPHPKMLVDVTVHDKGPTKLNWPLTHTGKKSHGLSAAWYIECQIVGGAYLNTAVEIDPGRRNGVPVLQGTGFTVAQVFAELAETTGVEEVAENFDLNAESIRELLNGFSLIMQRPSSR